MKRLLGVAFLSIIIMMGAYAQKQEGLAMKPPMGWNSWNKFHTDIDEEKIRGVIDAMIETGLRDAGYIYVNLDDAWHGQRDSLGFITCDPDRFPSGMKALADYAHDRGMKFGLYSDAGYQTCALYPGSRGHEFQDAITYAQWGVDYLKFDWFRQELVGAEGAYTLMRDALYSTGRPIVFSICEWGENNTLEWAPGVGHLWRTGGDIGAYFDVSPCHEKSILEVIENNCNTRAYAGPDHWNDPDNLEVGNGMTINQDRSHFTIWCMMASPLILGNDVRNMDRETLDILKNAEVIAIDQDPLGIQGLRLKVEDGVQYWLKPLEGGDWAFCLFNVTKEPVRVNLNWADLDITDDVSGLSTDLKSHTYAVRDLWRGKSDGHTDRNRILTVPAEDVILYRLIR